MSVTDVEWCGTMFRAANSAVMLKLLKVMVLVDRELPSGLVGIVSCVAFSLKRDVADIVRDKPICLPSKFRIDVSCAEVVVFGVKRCRAFVPL